MITFLVYARSHKLPKFLRIKIANIITGMDLLQITERAEFIISRCALHVDFWPRDCEKTIVAHYAVKYNFRSMIKKVFAPRFLYSSKIIKYCGDFITPKKPELLEYACYSGDYEYLKKTGGCHLPNEMTDMLYAKHNAVYTRLAIKSEPSIDARFAYYCTRPELMESLLPCSFLARGSRALGKTGNVTLVATVLQHEMCRLSLNHWNNMENFVAGAVRKGHKQFLIEVASWGILDNQLIKSCLRYFCYYEFANVF